MHFLKLYNQKILKQNSLYKYSYTHIEKLPYITKVLLHFDFLKPNHKKLTFLLLALELISSKSLDYSKASSLSVYLKTKKGLFIKCKLVLTKKPRYIFTENVFLKKIFTLKKKISFKKEMITFSFKNVFNYLTCKKTYALLKQLPNLHITLYTKSKTQSELKFVLKLYNIF